MRNSFVALSPDDVGNEFDIYYGKKTNQSIYVVMLCKFPIP